MPIATRLKRKHSQSIMPIVVIVVLLLSGMALQAADDVAPAPSVIQIAGRYVIDVRSQEEWDSGHIEGAVHIPYDQIAVHIAEITSDKTAHIGLYCRSGGRAALALATLKDKGYANVENLGGIATARKTLGLDVP
jgi:phage shock protein E